MEEIRVDMRELPEHDRAISPFRAHPIPTISPRTSGFLTLS